MLFMTKAISTFAICALLAGCATGGRPASPTNLVTLDEALAGAATDLGSKVLEKTVIAVTVYSGSGSWWQALITGGGIGIGLIATFATGYYEEEQVMRNNQWVLEETDRYIPAWYIGLPLAIGTNAVGNVQKITATGDVVRGSGSAGVRSQGRPVQQGLPEAVTRAAEVLIQDMPRDTTIAVLNINSRDFSIAEYVIDELEYLIVRSRQFRMVDRNRLEQIRREQNFQMSGEVSDTSAVSIDNLLGANIVVTGDIRENRLVLRVLDVQTAQIITMAREQL